MLKRERLKIFLNDKGLELRKDFLIDLKSIFFFRVPLGLLTARTILQQKKISPYSIHLDLDHYIFPNKELK